jgi:hypothetical protein
MLERKPLVKRALGTLRRWEIVLIWILALPRFFVVFLSLSRHFTVQYFKTGLARFLPHPF